VATLGDLKARIADELLRSDLTAQIAKAITSAIAHYGRQEFYFNQARSSGTFNTVASQEWYSTSDLAAIATSPRIISLTLVNDTTRYEITRRTFDEIEVMASDSVAGGMPTDWAYWRKQVRLWPIPDQVWSITMNYVDRLAAPADDASSNAWTLEDDAEELIRTRAKIDLLVNVIRRPDMGGELTLLRAQEMAALAALRGEIGGREATGFVVATQW
jgi:hypothetical protein